MKKIRELHTPLEKSTSEKNLNIYKTKTTNVNILLNRVRQDKKKEIKKKFFLTSSIFLILSLISFVTFK